ncbi:MAG: hypothetical protein WA952_02690 [Lewinella sp.]
MYCILFTRYELPLSGKLKIQRGQTKGGVSIAECELIDQLKGKLRKQEIVLTVAMLQEEAIFLTIRHTARSVEVDEANTIRRLIRDQLEGLRRKIHIHNLSPAIAPPGSDLRNGKRRRVHRLSELSGKKKGPGKAGPDQIDTMNKHKYDDE